MDLGKDSYTTAAAVQSYLDRTLSANENAILAYVIPAASRWIDRALGTCFDKLATDGSAQVGRYFKGGHRTLDIDHCQQITKVQAINPYDFSVWYTYTAPLEYIAEPINYPVKTYLEMRRNEFTGNHLEWPGDEAGVLVTALYTEYDYTANNGAGDYPSDIKMLANHIAAVWLQNNQNTEDSQQETVEGHQVIKWLDDMLEHDPMVARIMESRQEVWMDDM